MTTLALTSPAAATTTATLTARQWIDLPLPCRDKLTLMKKLVKLCAGLKHGNKRAAFDEIAASAGIGSDGKPVLDGETLRKRFYDFAKRGEIALIDHRLCGGKCGQVECNNRDRASLLPQALIDYWMQKGMESRSFEQRPTATQTLRHAWREVINELIAGKALPGVGDWRQVQLKLRGSVSARCPYTLTTPPAGMSYQNFMAHKPDAKVIAAGQRGLGALMPMLPPVRMDYATLEPQQLIIIDDVDLDVRVWGEFEGVMQEVELWALMIMDVCTRRIVWAQLHPRWTRADGTKTGISRRDVQHCFAHYLLSFGLPVNYKTTAIIENASATITKDVEELFSRVTDGRLEFKRSGVFDGSVLLGGFAQRGGNPRGKAALESYFKRFHIAFGGVPGQTGANYLVEPGDRMRRSAFVTKVLNKLGNVATDGELMILTDVESVLSVRGRILEALSVIENNPDHELLGFEKRPQWRLMEGSEWRGFDDPLLDEIRSSIGTPGLNAFLAKPGIVETPMETPVQKWDRLRKDADFTRLHPDVVTDLMLDVARVEYEGTGFARAKVGVLSWDFEGVQHSARAGDVIFLRFDADNPGAGAWLQDERGCYLGRMLYTQRHQLGDEEALAAELRMRSRGRMAVINETRAILENRETMLRKINHLREGTALVTTINERANLLEAPSDAAKALDDAVQGREGTALLAGDAKRQKGRSRRQELSQRHLEANAAQAKALKERLAAIEAPDFR